MKTLLRSCIVATATDVKDKDAVLRNYFNLYDSGLAFEADEDVPIWKFVQDFVQAHGHAPEANTLRGHFTAIGETQVLGRLDAILTLKSLTGGDFLVRLADKAEARRVLDVNTLLKEAAVIVQQGMEIKQGYKDKTILKGPIDAVRYILDRSHGIVAPTLGGRLSGEVTGDGVDFLREYERKESDPLAGVGQHTGLEQMDTALNGAKKHELWVHAGFTGHGKSMLQFNWAYNQAVWYHHSCVIFSLEMPYPQVRNILFSMHSAHEKFRAIRHQLGLQQDPNATVGLPYAHLRDGVLHEWHPNAKQFLYDYVIPDLDGIKVVDGIDPNTGEPWADPKHYGKIHIEVADPDKSDFTVADLRQRAEIIYSKTPFRMIFVDHAGLMAPRKWVPSTTDRLNEVIRDCKRLAMSFNRGAGIAVVALFQLSRDGHRQALKCKEKTGMARYELTSLSYANECERSADVVTCSWLDNDLSKENRIQFQCLKSRDTKPFEIFQARVEWPCRRFLTCEDMIMSAPERQMAGEALDADDVNAALGDMGGKPKPKGGNAGKKPK